MVKGIERGESRESPQWRHAMGFCVSEEVFYERLEPKRSYFGWSRILLGILPSKGFIIQRRKDAN